MWRIKEIINKMKKERKQNERSVSYRGLSNTELFYQLRVISRNEGITEIELRRLYPGLAVEVYRRQIRDSLLKEGILSIESFTERHFKILSDNSLLLQLRRKLRGESEKILKYNSPVLYRRLKERMIKGRTIYDILIEEGTLCTDAFLTNRGFRGEDLYEYRPHVDPDSLSLSGEVTRRVDERYTNASDFLGLGYGVAMEWAERNGFFPGGENYN